MGVEEKECTDGPPFTHYDDKYNYKIREDIHRRGD
jgi:hypothetical protein